MKEIHILISKPSKNQSHELRHAVPVIVGRSECFLSHRPARGKYHEVSNSCSLKENFLILQGVPKKTLQRFRITYKGEGNFFINSRF